MKELICILDFNLFSGSFVQEIKEIKGSIKGSKWELGTCFSVRGSTGEIGKTFVKI
jgi:hypothetical protein